MFLFSWMFPLYELINEVFIFSFPAFVRQFCAICVIIMDKGFGVAVESVFEQEHQGISTI